MKVRRLGFLLLLLSGLSPVAAASRPDLAQHSVPRIDYRVEVADIEAKLFGVTATVSNASSEFVDLSMPAWTPGWYVIADYARNLRKFQAKSADGRALRVEMLDKQTWRIFPAGAETFTVTYQIQADRLHVNGAEIRPDHAYFVGTNLFLYVPGHTTDVPFSVTFNVPDGWRIATPLQSAGRPGAYSAANFDVLVDSPTILGKFDEEMFQEAGRTFRVVFDPQGEFSASDRERVARRLQKVVAAEVELFGEAPFKDYWFLFLFGPQSRGGLEHENSTNIVLDESVTRAPEALTGVAAHEFFHVWNVKRIKPAALLPYDYRGEQYVRELWFSEGVTDYYTEVSLYRAGLIGREEFLGNLSRSIASHQSNDTRRWVSAEEASFTTWLGYEEARPFSVDYYNKGALLGLLLDLELRAATRGKRSLDDVLRVLYSDFYKKGRGFTDAQLESLVSQLAGREFADFFSRYVAGVEELPFDEVLGKAGFRLEARKENRPVLGVQTSPDGDHVQITAVTENSSAAEAGLQPGDILVSVGSVDVSGDADWAERFRAAYRKRSGEPIEIKVRRNGREMNLTTRVRTREVSGTRIVESPNPTSDQLLVREGWLAASR